MVKYDNDLRLIKAVGLAIAAFGIILLILSTTTVALALLRMTPTTTATYTYTSVVQVILALVMSFTMIACGAQLAHPEPLIVGGLETLRLNWAALFGFMIVTWLAGFWLIPVLGGLSLVILLLLVVIRPSVIRLS